MSAPRLNRRMTLEAAERAPDGAGGFVETWVTLGTLWADVAPRSGRIATGEGGAVSATAFRVTLRAAPVGQSDRPAAGQRLRMGTRLFRIEAVTESDASALYLTCQCEEEIAP